MQKEKFTDKLYISASLIESLNKICALNMGDKTQVQIYLRKQGVLMFDEQQRQMLACKTAFDGTVEKVQSNVKVINGEKFTMNAENDYK